MCPYIDQKIRDFKNKDSDLYSVSLVDFEASKDGPDLPRWTAFCHNPAELRRRLAARRGKLEDLPFLTSKLALDHGKDFLKETMTLFDLRDFDLMDGEGRKRKRGEEDDEDDGRKKKKRDTSILVEFKDTSVRKVQVTEIGGFK